VDVALDIAGSLYQTDQGDTIVAFRPFVEIGFPNRANRLLTLRAIVDTGAPLSVVPYEVWKSEDLAWSSISSTLTRRGKRSGLEWRGVVCELGFAEIELMGVRRLTAKFVMQPARLSEVILGANFLVDNDIELVLRGAGRQLSGFLALP
jgi:hypothetical protein